MCLLSMARWEVAVAEFTELHEAKLWAWRLRLGCWMEVSASRDATARVNCNDGLSVLLRWNRA